MLLAPATWAATDTPWELDDANQQRLQALLEGAVEADRIAAGIAMIAHGEQVVWTASAGEMAPGIPMIDDPILPLASVGKMFTAVAAMILVERGEIGIDDPVSDYLPSFSEVRVRMTMADGSEQLVPADRPMTVRHLLTHTSGLIVDGDTFWSIWDRHVGTTTSTTTDFAIELAQQPLHSQPGETFLYGQTGAAYEVLGAVIEIASGMTLEAFMHAEIFAPLDLHDSYFYLPAAKAARLPTIYRRGDDGLVVDRPMGEDFSRSTFLHGGGGVRTSPQDVHRFARLFLEGGSVDGVRLLQPETVRMMTTDQLGDRVPERWRERGRSWGFGAAVGFDPADATRRTRTYGWVGGGFATLWVDLDRRIIAYINTTLTPPGDNDLLYEYQRAVDTALEAGAPAAD